MKKFLVILVLITLLFSCQRKVIDTMKVFYYNGIFTRITVISCDEIDYNLELVDTSDVLLADGSSLPKEAVVLETVIADKRVLKEIANELKQASKTENFDIDTRMKCYIQYSDGSIDTLCLSKQPTLGYYNNEPKAFTNKFVYLIRKNSGFYWWIGTDYMQNFDELNDTTFRREKVRSRWGGEY